MKRLAKIMGAVGSNTSPPPHLIFEWLRHAGPGEAVGVLSGQDPYPAGADGLAFSSSESIDGVKSLPGSLRNVAKCLEVSGLSRPFAQGDLVSWAAQGLLMPNIALTTELNGKPGAHRAKWGSFVRDLVAAIAEAAESSRAPRKLFFMLWGKDAVGYLSAVATKTGGRLLTWTHPSATYDCTLAADKRFVNCTNFADADRFLGRRFVWDTATPVMVFTDGACKGNGKKTAAAGSGVLIVGGHLCPTKLLTGVAPFAYAFVDTDAPERGFAAGSGAVAPSSNRGELLAICWALLLLVLGDVRGAIVIISDSQISVNILNSWLATRRKNDKSNPKNTKPASDLKNYDLIVIAEALLAKVRERAASCELRWAPASHDSKRPAGPPLARLMWRGNDIADELAVAGKEGKPASIVTPHTRLRTVVTSLLNT